MVANQVQTQWYLAKAMEYSEHCETSKKELFVEVNKYLIVFAKVKLRLMLKGTFETQFFSRFQPLRLKT